MDILSRIFNPTGSMVVATVDEVKQIEAGEAANQESVKMSTETGNGGEPMSEIVALSDQTGDIETLENVERGIVDRGKVIQMESKDPSANSIAMAEGIGVANEQKVVDQLVDPAAIVQANVRKQLQFEKWLNEEDENGNTPRRDEYEQRVRNINNRQIIGERNKQYMQSLKNQDQEAQASAAGAAALAVGAVGIGLGISASLNRKRKKEDEK